MICNFYIWNKPFAEQCIKEGFDIVIGPALPPLDNNPSYFSITSFQVDCSPFWKRFNELRNEATKKQWPIGTPIHLKFYITEIKGKVVGYKEITNCLCMIEVDCETYSSSCTQQEIIQYSVQ